MWSCVLNKISNTSYYYYYYHDLTQGALGHNFKEPGCTLAHFSRLSRFTRMWIVIERLLSEYILFTSAVKLRPRPAPGRGHGRSWLPARKAFNPQSWKKCCHLVDISHCTPDRYMWERPGPRRSVSGRDDTSEIISAVLKAFLRYMIHSMSCRFAHKLLFWITLNHFIFINTLWKFKILFI